MAIGAIRNIGGGKMPSSQILGRLDTLTRTYPSYEGTTPGPRTFTKNSYVIGLAYNNSYQPTEITNINFNLNSVTFYTRQGYGMGFVLNNAEKGASYKATYTLNGNTAIRPLYYDASGAFTMGTMSANGEFTVPANAEYVVLLIYNSLTTATLTSFNLTKIERIS